MDQRKVKDNIRMIGKDIEVSTKKKTIELNLVKSNYIVFNDTF